MNIEKEEEKKMITKEQCEKVKEIVKKEFAGNADELITVVCQAIDAYYERSKITETELAREVADMIGNLNEDDFLTVANFALGEQYRKEDINWNK